MQIKLQSSFGGFEPDFITRLEEIERAMIARGLDPSMFVISKDYAASSHNRPIGLSSFFYDYTVFVGDEHFTVTHPNDASFLEFFVKRCLAAADDDSEEDAANSATTPKPAGVLSRLVSWFNQPV